MDLLFSTQATLFRYSGVFASQLVWVVPFDTVIFGVVASAACCLNIGALGNTAYPNLGAGTVYAQFSGIVLPIAAAIDCSFPVKAGSQVGLGVKTANADCDCLVIFQAPSQPVA